MASGSQVTGPAFQRSSEGQVVYNKNLRIPGENLPALEKLIKVGVILSLNDALATASPEQANQVRAQTLDAETTPERTQITEIPDNMTLETEWHESENRTVMKMKIRPDPKARPSPEALRFNFECLYMTDEGEKEISDTGILPLGEAMRSLGTNLDQLALPDVSHTDDTKSNSSGETEYLSDMEAEEASNEKAAQTEIALGELLFSESIGSISSAEVASVAVQTHITALNVSDHGISGEGSVSEEQEEQSTTMPSEASTEEYPNGQEFRGESTVGGIEEASLEEPQDADSGTEEASLKEPQEADSGTEEASLKEPQKADSGTEEASLKEPQKADSGTEEASLNEPQKADSGTEEASLKEPQKADSSTEAASIEDPQDAGSCTEEASIKEPHETVCGIEEASIEESLEAVSCTEEASIKELQEFEERSTIPVPGPSEDQNNHEIRRTNTSSGVPQCLLRGDPPWVDPLIDTYTVMWDTHLEVLPNEVRNQFIDTIFPIASGLHMPEVDPLLQMRRSAGVSGTAGFKMGSNQRALFGSFVLPSSSTVVLKRDPELFNIHIDLNTWGFPAALHERYATAAASSTITLLDDLPSTGELLYMTDEDSSMYSIYTPTSVTKHEENNEDRLERLSAGFLLDDAQDLTDAPGPPDAPQSNREIKELPQVAPKISNVSGSNEDPPDALQSKREIKELPQVASKISNVSGSNEERSISDVILPPVRRQKSDVFNKISNKRISDELLGTEIERSSPNTLEANSSSEGSKSLSKEQLGTAIELKSPARTPSGHAETSEYEEEANLSPSLPLALVLTVNDQRPLILIMDPGDLPMSIAIGTKNVPLNNATALCAIKKLDGNMFRINNIELSESAITDLRLEQREPDKVKCKIKVDGDVRGEDFKELASLGSTLLLNLPIEQAETLQKDPQAIQHAEDGASSPPADTQRKPFPDKMFAPEDINMDSQAENGADEEQWKEGLPEPEDTSLLKADTLCMQPLGKSDVFPDKERILSSPTPESIKRKSGCRCKTAPPDRASYSKQPDVYSKPSSKNRYGVLARTLKEFEQQISPLHRALDDIRCKIESLDVEESGKAASPVCSEDSLIHNRCDSGYEQEIAELISAAQRECIRAKFPDLEADFLPVTKARYAQPIAYPPYAEGCCAERIYSSPQIQCVSESPADLWAPRRRKTCMRTWQREEAPCCSRNRNMPQRAAMDMGITYLVPNAIAMVSPSPWLHSSEFGCCNAPPTETIVYHPLNPKKARNVCPMWTSEY